MDSARFDRLSRRLALRQSRRSAVRGAGAGLAALLGGAAGVHGATAQEATPPATPVDGSAPSLLFVQTASGGGFSPNPQTGMPAVAGTPTVGGGADYLLTLEGHHGTTIYFSDRPDRIFGNLPTQQFLDTLGFTPEFPPNVALVTQADDDADDDEVIILELIEPAYDEAAGTVTYGATILGGYAGQPLTQIVADGAAPAAPERFGRASLFIDDLPNNVPPGEVPQYNCLMYSCLFPSGALYFPIPGGPYDGWQRPYQNLNNSCQPINAVEYNRFQTICSDDPRCPGVCTPY